MKKLTKTLDERLAEERAMEAAIAAYAGPVTRCPPGRARGKYIVTDAAEKFLDEHRFDTPTPDAKAERRRMRIERLQQQHIARRNAPLLAQVNKRERTIKRNTALIRQRNERISDR